MESAEVRGEGVEVRVEVTERVEVNERVSERAKARVRAWVMARAKVSARARARVTDFVQEDVTLGEAGETKHLEN